MDAPKNQAIERGKRAKFKGKKKTSRKRPRGSGRGVPMRTV